MKVDPILLSVYARTFRSITDEMSISMTRTTRSPILCEAKDFVTGLYDAEGRMLHGQVVDDGESVPLPADDGAHGLQQDAKPGPRIRPVADQQPGAGGHRDADEQERRPAYQPTEPRVQGGVLQPVFQRTHRGGDELPVPAYQQISGAVVGDDGFGQADPAMLDERAVAAEGVPLAGRHVLEPEAPTQEDLLALVAAGALQVGVVLRRRATLRVEHAALHDAPPARGGRQDETRLLSLRDDGAPAARHVLRTRMIGARGGEEPRTRRQPVQVEAPVEARGQVSETARVRGRDSMRIL